MKKILYLLAFATTLGCGDGKGGGQSLTLIPQNTAVVLVDLQNDFTQWKEGSLGVGNADGKGAAPRTGEAYIKKVKGALQYFKEKGFYMVATQDFHPKAKHISFASSHGKKPWAGANGGPLFILHDGKGNVLTKNGPKPFGTEVKDLITYPSFAEATQAASQRSDCPVVQALWPEHCKQGQSGSQLVEGIAHFFPEENRVKKGQDPNLESYSGFYEGFTDGEDKLKFNKKSTLHTKLQGKNIENIIVFGLATDYCVGATAKDGVDFDYQVVFVSDISEGVASDTAQGKCKEMEAKGVKIMTFEELKKQIK